jgi:glycosyltransferase involved in cell wall biosynthesis
VALVILALNEEEGLENTYNRYKKIYTRLKLDHEFFIVNDGSTDRTGEIAENIKKKDPCITVFHNSKPMGMGYGYKQGLQKTNKDYYMYTGGYDNLPEEYILAFINGMGKFDIVAGYISNPEIRATNRRALSSIFTRVVNLVTGLNLKYYNGMDLARTECLKSIKILSNGYTFQAECIAKLALMHNCTYQQIPLILEDRGKSQSNAVKPKNFLDAGKFLIFLIYEIIAFRLKR